ncbi:hypothetical protein TCAL_06017 [Tigriopus californicus]|uniref:Uncharacterized protein n=1 Tax=Tigriopus californicus TaxID=6832 RepID=A0A553P6Q4_TIGCA|nr:uncharacterized protein LOC131877731 isoform X2 [Tigriopus californicus]XP_059079478.1 uncharacterized protein LOC131877731 isoform X2 [Tigriopus californicus]XP_059079479.1 uncharacterized protein LOC131877731 isoform X2 [Tigriopus californicus]TRY73361.1 hypothetical protein TCAL_06017 [Tigriopus californicus]|eukprot:TCALIF_06017-PA protein Name:"Protein of unknown function" AED:0.00 eAED:0.00 QI:906/1/1/1/0.66/0.6/10/83/461
MATSSYISSCICCSLLTGCIFTGIVTMFLYLAAFVIEVWWIIEAEVQLPIPAYLLTLIYFFLTILAISMLVGLRTKKTRLVLAWIIFFLLSVIPEGGMVLFMSVYSWHGGVYGVIELTMWVCRTLISVVGTMCIHSLYCAWKDEKSVLRSLQELNVTSGDFHPHGIAGEYQQKLAANSTFLGYQNEGFNGSFPSHIHPSGGGQHSALAITKYSSSSTSANSKPSYSKSLKRSSSAASGGFVSASRLSLNDIGLAPQQFNHMPLSDQLSTVQRQLSRLSLNITDSGYRKTEFDTSKFSRSLVSKSRTLSQWDLPSFGMDPDAPVFLQSGTYGKGGQSISGIHQSLLLSGDRKTTKSSLQWYRPRSLVNLEDDTSSIWSGIGQPVSQYNSLNRQKLSSQFRAQSLGALNFGHLNEEALLHGSVGPYFHFRPEDRRPRDFPQGGSRISLGQYSDHIDRYRDVAL